MASQNEIVREYDAKRVLSSSQTVHMPRHMLHLFQKDNRNCVDVITVAINRGGQIRSKMQVIRCDLQSFNGQIIYDYYVLSDDQLVFSFSENKNGYITTTHFDDDEDWQTDLFIMAIYIR